MSIAVVCSKCSAKLNAPDGAAGKNVKCPKCQTAMFVSIPLPKEPGFEEVDEPAPAKKPAPKAAPKVKADVILDDDEEEERPRKKRVQAETEDDDEEDRPKKRRKKQDDEGDSNMVRNIIGGVVLLVLLGVAGWVFYDKFGKKKDEETAGGNTGGNPTPGNIPPPPGGLNVPGGNPGGSKTAKLLQLGNEYVGLLKQSANALNQISDGPMALAAAKQLQANTARLRELNAEVKGLNFTPQEAVEAYRNPPPAGLQAAVIATQAAVKKVQGLIRNLPPDAAKSLGEALTICGLANIEFGTTLQSLAPKKP